MKKRLLLYSAALGAVFLLSAADRDERDREENREEAPRAARVETGRGTNRPSEARPAAAARPAAESRPAYRAPERTAGPGFSAPPQAPREVRPGGGVIRIIREAAPPVQVRPGSVTRDIRAGGPPVEVRPESVARPIRESAPPIEIRPGGVTRDIRETAPPIETRPAGQVRNFREAAPEENARPVVIPEPRRFTRPEAVVNDDRRPVEPRVSESGEPVRGERERKPPEWHRSVTRDPEIAREIQAEQRAETAHGRYYWHNRRGLRYAHYYDENNIHWYGFYRGPRFYWCRYYAGNWWWYDDLYARWVFWWDGYWWWWGPGAIAYVYVNDDYYPYSMESGRTVVESPETAGPPPLPPSPYDGEQWLTPDQERLVQVYGDGAYAYLYDNTGEEPVYLAYLGRDVTDVRFTEGPPDRIILYFKDGAFALYDTDGNPKEAPPSEPPQADQPPAPESIPPLPDSAPGI